MGWRSCMEVQGSASCMDGRGHWTPRPPGRDALREMVPRKQWKEAGGLPGQAFHPPQGGQLAHGPWQCSARKGAGHLPPSEAARRGLGGGHSSPQNLKARGLALQESPKFGLAKGCPVPRQEADTGILRLGGSRAWQGAQLSAPSLRGN